MDSYGNIKIAFSKKMVLIPEVHGLKSSGIKLAKAQQSVETQEPAGRLLSEKEGDITVQLEILSLNV